MAAKPCVASNSERRVASLLLELKQERGINRELLESLQIARRQLAKARRFLPTAAYLVVIKAGTESTDDR